MSSEEKYPSYLTDTILHCSILVCDTMVRMADLVTLTLLYHPGMEDRATKMEQLYENVINFIDDITSTIYQPEDRMELSINQYDPIFTHLKNVSKLMVDLIAILSQEHLTMQLQTMEYFYNLNKAILTCITVLNQLVHSELSDIQTFDKTQITALEMGAHELYRLLLKELPGSANEWQQAFTLHLVGEKMSAIVFHCCEAGKKIYAARFASIGLGEDS
ncbi:MAG: hypothetical protein H7641_06645 [Candidatus Heimdallarchaeota archaeon]|nr:hypothetical protein [Candidatus Heimdallarchaeota archaeon]MCK4877242.1 hypothetical protein [Candidatus Heimdallarchaeota archaeon]